MPNPIKDELVATQPWILEAGFKIVKYDYSYKAMGSSMVLLESGTLRTRFVRDRGSFVYVEIGPQGERLWELSLVMEAINGERPKYDAKLPQVASLLHENLPVLQKAFGQSWPETKQELERRYQERVRASRTPHPISPEARQTLLRLRSRRYLRLIGPVVAVAIILWLASR